MYKTLLYKSDSQGTVVEKLLINEQLLGGKYKKSHVQLCISRTLHNYLGRSSLQKNYMHFQKYLRSTPMIYIRLYF